MSAERPPEPVELSTLRAWHRTGLALVSVAFACFAGFLAHVLVMGRDGAVGLRALLGFGVFVCGLIGLGFLRRAWADPQVEHDPQVVLARRLSSVAMTSWAVAVVPNALYLGPTEAPGWLGTLSADLGAVALVCFVVMLAVAARWTPPGR
jgi:uncharacterized membrane protein YidH (DUF202 family)